ncbi:MAG: NAD(+)/NADH kinase [Proteobacteria bacterium]|nr:NAD(+)/NADH kinase [Pseudomonadota bacterium]MDA1064182.1 NAD(+)/NADH kinase [Pseudomonadota bacterium]
MSIKIERVAILGRHDDSRVAEPMTVLVEHLTKLGILVLCDEQMRLELPVKRIATDALSTDSDLMIAIGGDGTMLYAGNLARTTGVPLLGINRGRLGFLADVSPDEMLASVDHILAGKYSLESRQLLRARLSRAGANVGTETAFNDIVLQRRETGRMVDLVASIDDTYVNTHSGDGLIVATATGSTAYALSCGGPIIDPRLDAVVIVPICPHTLTDRPIVVPSSKSISIRMLEREDTQAEVVIDGRTLGAIGPEDLLTISASEQRIQLIHPPGYDYFSILRSKLFWGRDSRVREEVSH